jgi:hypothetical protein
MAATPRRALTMGSVGLLALAANVGVALLLYAWRDGDANMRGVWLCTRNDALSNVAVMLAALKLLARAQLARPGGGRCDGGPGHLWRVERGAPGPPGAGPLRRKISRRRFAGARAIKSIANKH